MADLNSSEVGFGRGLRQERERRKISLASIATTTKISASLLAALERDDLSRWPTGIFRRSFVRAYAEAIGVDPDRTVREFLDRFPDPDEPPEPVVDAPATPIAREGVATGHLPRVRLRFDQMARSFQRGIVLSEPRRRWAAAAWDAGVLVAIALLLFVIVNSFWKPFGVLTLTYYVGGILVLGNTPGVCLFGSANATNE